MGLLSRPVIEVLERIKPRNTRDADWADQSRYLIEGNEQLAELLASDDLAPAFVRGSGNHPKAHWRRGYNEHGGTATPWSRPAEPYTSWEQYAMTPKDVAPGGIFYHSHPGAVERIGGGYVNNSRVDGPLKIGVGLSAPDYMWMIGNADPVGITSLDPHGGLGYAIKNPNAPSRIWEKIQSMPKPETTQLYKSLGDDVVDELGDLTGSAGWSDQVSISPLGMMDIVTSEGIGRALKKVGVLDHQGYEPGSDAARRGAELMEPAIQTAEDFAVERIAGYLRKMGFTSGKISAIIAAAVSSGSVGSLLAHLQREEATKDEIA